LVLLAVQVLVVVVQAVGHLLAVLELQIKVLLVAVEL
jgi:hypothetical protein